MRWFSLFAGLGLFLGVDAASSQTCSTKYTSTSTTVKRTTISSTRTATVTVTSPSYQTATVVDPATTTTITSFYNSSTTFYFTKAKATTTIPTTAGFLPMASAPTGEGATPVKRNAGPLNARAATSYPYQVVCTNYNTVTSTSTYQPIEQITTTTYTQTPRTVTSTRTYTTWNAKSSTISVATRTVHAACGPSNVINTYDLRGINYWDTNGFKNGLDDSDPSDPDFAAMRAAAQSPTDCCEAAWTLGYSGFEFYGSPGYDATCVGSSGAGEAIFVVGPYGGTNGPVWCGNGPGGNPNFLGFYDASNPVS